MIEQCTASAIAQHNQKSEWLALERAKAGSDAENARQNELASAANRKAWNFLTSQHRSDRQIFENLVTRSRVEKVIKANNKTRRSTNILPSSKRCDYIFYYPTFSSTIFFAWLLFCYSYKCGSVLHWKQQIFCWVCDCEWKKEPGFWYNITWWDYSRNRPKPKNHN